MLNKLYLARSCYSEFKGSGLAWMVDILSGVLTGSSHGGKIKDPLMTFQVKMLDPYLLQLIQKFFQGIVF